MLARLTTALQGALERLRPRERVLLGVMVMVALGMVCFLVVLLSHRSLSGLEEQVEHQALLLAQLRDTAPELRERMEVSAEAEAGTAVEPPALGTQLQTHATEAGMAETDLEIMPQPDERVGAWVKSSVELRLRRKPLGELSKFWALTASDRAEFPVAITKLNIRRRMSEEDAYDVEMVVSSYAPSTEPAEDESSARGRTKTKRSKRP
jgi:hypothetical protein